MPKYKIHPEDYKVDDQIARKIWNCCINDKERALIGILWRYQPREGEVIRISRDGVKWNDKWLILTIPTLKLKKGGAFKLKERNLPVERGTGEALDVFIESIIQWAQKVPMGTPLFPHTEGWVYKCVIRRSETALGTPITPYHFRHWGFTRIVEKYGASEANLAYWKGGGISSVKSYVHAVPMALGLREGKPVIMFGLVADNLVENKGD